MPQIHAYFSELQRLSLATKATQSDGCEISLEQAIDKVIARVVGTKADGGKVMFVGNGGSAGIASHSAIDYMKNGTFPSVAFNDGALLTCLANDLGYENVFAVPVGMLGKPQDLLIAISSSGNSPNIGKAVAAARTQKIYSVTFSGFKPNNALRVLGDINFYVPSDQYGFVELIHQTIIHAILDIQMGWAQSSTKSAQ
jgi:D-sedoheptulose 7-phosphate isomerase